MCAKHSASLFATAPNILYLIQTRLLFIVTRSAICSIPMLTLYSLYYVQNIVNHKYLISIVKQILC